MRENIEMSDIIIIGVTEGKEEENRAGKIFKMIMVEKFPEPITLMIQKGQ